MPDLSSFSPLVDWIESHEKTVDLLKWVALLLVAWAVGLFKFLRQKFRLPIATIEEQTISEDPCDMKPPVTSVPSPPPAQEIRQP